MPYSNYHNPFHIGMRNIKTAVAATLCAVIYFLIDRNPAFACIGAIFGMGADMSGSRLSGGNRFFGTVFGGLLGMGLYRFHLIFYPQGGYTGLLLVLLFIGVIALVLVCTGFKWAGAIQPGGVVLCIILFSTPVETYLSYSINRIVDTGVGVLIALGVNYFFPRERVVHWLEQMHLRRKAKAE